MNVNDFVLFFHFTTFDFYDIRLRNSYIINLNILGSGEGVPFLEQRPCVLSSRRIPKYKKNKIQKYTQE